MSEPFLAQVIMFGGNFAPRSWAYCDGQNLPINTHQSLYSLLGTTYGGDGRTSFDLPDLRGRVPVGPGAGAGLGTDYSEGTKTGAEENYLSSENLPPHTHMAAGAMNVLNGTGNQRVPTNNVLAADPPNTDKRYAPTETADSTLAADAVTVTVQNAGGGQGINNIQPIMTLHYIICMNGLFPSRN